MFRWIREFFGIGLNNVEPTVSKVVNEVKAEVKEVVQEVKTEITKVEAAVEKTIDKVKKKRGPAKKPKKSDSK